MNCSKQGLSVLAPQVNLSLPLPLRGDKAVLWAARVGGTECPLTGPIGVLSAAPGVPDSSNEGGGVGGWWGGGGGRGDLGSWADSKQVSSLEILQAPYKVN